jgi:hypothetical protein
VPQQPGSAQPAPAPQTLDARTPILFLPVNIETRFMDGTATADAVRGAPELWVRIYPDQIAINSHELELTNQEIADGKTYWDNLWRAGNPPPSLDAAKAPWRGLASLYGSQRAAWIALQMQPTNLAQQPVNPVPDGANPNPAPVYPQPPVRQSSWTEPAIADALPDAWTVVTVSSGQTAQFRGGPITIDLAVGLTPGGGVFAPGSPVDPGMKWLVDFDTALSVGMALKIPLTADQRAKGFDRIFVFGLRTKGATNDTFAGLLDAHHYTDGFSIVPQGAPTNNTLDASSAYSRKDPNYEISFAVERQGPLTQQSASDGNVFASLLGIDPAHLAHVGYADGFGARNGQDMLTTLWPATIGYFLSQMMYSVFTPDEIASARQYVLANAAPRGLCPAFRVGKTPYGVLPVTSLRRYRPLGDSAQSSIEPGLVNWLTRLWPNWLASAANAPHMQNTGDPDKELVNLLGMDASSMSFRGRQVLGDEFLWNYVNFLGISIPVLNPWWALHLVRGRQLLDTYGYNQWDPRVIHLGMAETGFPIGLPTVQAGALSETDPLNADANLGGGKTGNYIQWLRQASITDLQADNYPGPKPISLLYKILRQSAILDYVVLAAVAEIGAGRLQLSQFREVEIVGIAPATPPPAPTLSVWELLARPSVPNPLLSWADYLGSLNPPPLSPFARLTQFRASMDRLALLPTAELDRLLTETLDACSHRLDVWASAVPNAILQRTRNVIQNQASHLGAFGWVEEVRPNTPPPPVQGTELGRVQALDQLRTRLLKTPAVMPTPVQPSQDNGGFIYAPSLTQASVGAVLRNGYMTHKGTSEEGLLSIDLSSTRVRRALLLLDGVRQGQSLNALLGYLFESALHDSQLDQYIQPFRNRFPVVANKLSPSSDPTESVAASNVVDGLALRTAWDNGELAAGQNWGTGLPGPGADQNTIIGVLQTIDDYADALGDLSISEAVFQIMRGNFGTAGGLMDAISKGARPPPPEVINTPRGGLDLTHRLLLLLAGAPQVAAPWTAITQRPRAAAEPRLTAWLSQLLPDPATVTCNVEYHDQGGNKVKPVALADLSVGPLDCIAMADAAEVPQKSELEYRILYAAKLPSDADKVTIDFQPASPPAGWVSFPDFFFLVKSLRDLTGSSRVLTPQDLVLPEKNAQTLGGVVDLTELRARATTTIQNLANDVQALQLAIAGLPGATGPVRDALTRCSFYGVPGSVPYTSSDPDPALADQAASVLKVLQARAAQAGAVALPTANQDDVLGVFATIFGKGLIILPRFTPPDAPSLAEAFGQSNSLVAADPTAPARWIMQLTHIRPAISRLDAGLSLAQIIGAATDATAQLLLGQLPAVANDRWLGLPIDPTNPPAKGRVAFACLTQGSPVTDAPYAGLIMDEWLERIPSAQETAAVAFHYEEPKARAPQSLLLAVCPDASEIWDDQLVSEILQETLELAKIRTVDLDSVKQVGEILPALYFPLNLKGATVSANFTLQEPLRATQITGQ